jgi:hypothetical protein
MVAACLNNSGVARPPNGACPEQSEGAAGCEATGYLPAESSVALAGSAGEGGRATWTADAVKALPYPDGQALVLACMEINGLRAAKGEAGAAQART